MYEEELDSFIPVKVAHWVLVCQVSAGFLILIEHVHYSPCQVKPVEITDIQDFCCPSQVSSEKLFSHH